MKKILIVDDEQDTLHILKKKLSMEGYEVITAPTCKEGLLSFYSSTPDLVLLDINVGTEDGREMCHSIKKQALYQHVPVILFSANPQLLKLYADFGANASIDKPFDMLNLLKLIQAHI